MEHLTLSLSQSGLGCMEELEATRQEESLQERLACAKALGHPAASCVVREMWKGFTRCAKEIQSYRPVRLPSKKCEFHSQSL